MQLTVRTQVYHSEEFVVRLVFIAEHASKETTPFVFKCLNHHSHFLHQAHAVFIYHPFSLGTFILFLCIELNFSRPISVFLGMRSILIKE